MNALRWFLALPFMLGGVLLLLVAYVVTRWRKQTFAHWLTQALIEILEPHRVREP